MLTLAKDTVVTRVIYPGSSINEAMSVFLMPFLKLLSVDADLSSRLIVDQRSGPKCLRECLPYFVVLKHYCLKSEVIVCVTSVK